MPQERTLKEFKKQNLDSAMRDLKLDSQKPWVGPGPDPRADRWEEDNEMEDEEGEGEFVK